MKRKQSRWEQDRRNEGRSQEDREKITEELATLGQSGSAVASRTCDLRSSLALVGLVEQNHEKWWNASQDGHSESRLSLREVQQETHGQSGRCRSRGKDAPAE